MYTNFSIISENLSCLHQDIFFWPKVNIPGLFLLLNTVIYIQIDWKHLWFWEIWLKTDPTSTFFLYFHWYTNNSLSIYISINGSFLVPWYQLHIIVQKKGGHNFWINTFTVTWFGSIFLIFLLLSKMTIMDLLDKEFTNYKVYNNGVKYVTFFYRFYMSAKLSLWAHH